MISVITPVRNAQPYLSVALQSIMDQEAGPCEIIVIDDGSTDRSRDIAAGFPNVSVIDQQGLGLAAARNLGVSVASGDFIAFLDADDYWPRHRLRVALSYLENHPRDTAVIGQVVRFLEPGAPLPPAYAGIQLGQPVRGYTPGACLARRSLFDRIGGFDDNLIIGCDSDWFARMFDAGIPPAVLSDVVLHKRIHANNLSANTSLYRDDFLNIVRHSLQRRRAAPMQQSNVE